MSKLDAAEMIRNAERVTGLTDWDGDDFVRPLSTLVDALNEEAGLHESGRTKAVQWLGCRLEQRLRLVNDRKLRPEIAAQLIDRPVFIVGLPRAGTTYLHTLLSRDVSAIAPLYWQLMLPSPPPNDPAIDHRAAIRQIQEMLEFQGWLSPIIKAMHEHDAELPEEDFFAFEFAFISSGFMGFFDVPGYAAKVLSGDFTPAYEWHRRVLQALQIGAEGRRWMLKAPEHTMHLDTLLKVYPDAVIVQNHRDPSKVMASTFSLLSAVRSPYTERTSRVDQTLARQFVHMYAAGLGRGMQLRKDPAINRQFVDVHYLELERNPLAVVERVYRHADLPFTERVRDTVQAWVQNHRKGAHGKHKYFLGEYGLTQGEVQTAFKNYIEHYGIELEPGA